MYGIHRWKEASCYSESRSVHNATLGFSIRIGYIDVVDQPDTPLCVRYEYGHIDFSIVTDHQFVDFRLHRSLGTNSGSPSHADSIADDRTKIVINFFIRNHDLNYYQYGVNGSMLSSAIHRRYTIARSDSISRSKIAITTAIPAPIIMDQIGCLNGRICQYIVVI